MKKYLLLFLLAPIFVSCYMPIKSYKNTIVIDYAYYMQNGFFITESNSVSFEYKPIGSVMTTVKGEKRTDRGRQSYSVYDAMDEFANQCYSLGANGVIGFRIHYSYDKEYGLGYEITGMAIQYHR